MGNTTIAWTDATWNPTRGCSRVNKDCGGEPGQGKCYAIGQAHRFSGPGKPYEGLTRIRQVKTGKVRHDPDLDSLVAEHGGSALVDVYRDTVDWSGVVRLVPEMLDQPLRWRKPRRIFVDSMSDLFHPALTNEEIAAVFGVMAAAPRHTFQILTKRPKRMLEWFEWVASKGCAEVPPLGWNRAHVQALRCAADLLPEQLLTEAEADRSTYPWPLPNVWLGVSAGHQAALDEFVPLLLRTPAALRFVSIEPQTEEVDLARWLVHPDGRFGALMDALRHPDVELPAFQETMRRSLERLGILPEQALREPISSATLSAASPPDHPEGRLDWVITGGESGPGARPFDLAWARKTRDQCRAAGVPWFCKQIGARPYDRSDRRVARPDEFEDRAGADPDEWPEDLQLQLFPGDPWPMSNSIFHVRPLDSGKGWAIDEYDGRGAWQHSVPSGPDGAPMDKIQAQRAVFQLRRKAVNSAPKASPVNKYCAHREALGSGFCPDCEQFVNLLQRAEQDGIEGARLGDEFSALNGHVAEAQELLLREGAECGADGSLVVGIGRLVEQRDDLREVVAMVEWGGSALRLECPLCHSIKEKGHLAECLIAQTRVR